MTRRTLDHLLYRWPDVYRTATDPWAKGFAGSVLRQARRPDWRPTPRQEAVMQRMVSELFTTPVHRGADEDVILFEDST